MSVSLIISLPKNKNKKVELRIDCARFYFHLRSYELLMLKTVRQVTCNALGTRRNVVLFREGERICLFSTASNRALCPQSLQLEGYRGTFLHDRDVKSVVRSYLRARIKNE
jgi:hypothetical protein